MRFKFARQRWRHVRLQATASCPRVEHNLHTGQRFALADTGRVAVPSGMHYRGQIRDVRWD